MPQRRHIDDPPANSSANELHEKGLTFATSRAPTVCIMQTSCAAITPRRPHFSWADSPVSSWVPHNPDATHTLNAMHVLFPEGERAFCRVLGSALEHIDDAALKSAVRAFLTQEGLHAGVHQRAFVQLATTSPQLELVQERMAAVLRTLLGPRRTRNRYLLMWRLASVAAIEHLTTALGEWTMTGARLEENGCDPQMTALIKWHGAEEVEHRSVAFDAHRALQTRLAYPTRVAAMVFWLPTMSLLWAASAQALLRNDGAYPRRRGLSVRALRDAVRRGLIPDVPQIARGAIAFCKPGYHPSRHIAPEVVAAAEAWLRSDAVTRYTTLD